MAYPNYTTLPQYASILHLWKLDETSGTRSDFIATCHLTDNNTVLYGTGKIGNGADFKKDKNEYEKVEKQLNIIKDKIKKIVIFMLIIKKDCGFREQENN